MQKGSFSSLFFGALVYALLLFVYAPEKTLLEKVRDSGELRVLTRNAATTYYIGPHGPTGPEYELVKAFADYLGVRPRFVVEDNLQSILDKVASGEAHLAAAGLTVTEDREKSVRFTPSYQKITQQVVYRKGQKRPRSVKDLVGKNLEVLANSSHAERLAEFRKEFPGLHWTESEDTGSSELLTLVSEQVIDYTVADSNEIALVRRYHPDVRVAFSLTSPQELAWAMPRSQDESLYQAAVDFFTQMKNSGKLRRLLARHYDHVRNYDYAGTPTYLRHIQRRLPNYQELFQEAADKNDLDWRLLAAVGYQESHWNPLAVSPTGVRGLMMLTRVTAAQLGIKKRTDAAQSIQGGARYLRILFDQFSQVPEPDRTWLALAAYNVGYGHVKDAQKITAQRGGDPETWMDVKQSLPLLSKRKWYSKTRHGYARGNEPVRYVENIRSYYDILRWHIDRDAPLRQEENKPVLAFSSSVL
ncbi:MAG TPA: membrane-bound lytic murein transglycosylase MltF [Chromatiales bacterium]|nr:membrane-bound lytic murein transglycosylase MltF [Chromatiales bacterium]